MSIGSPPHWVSCVERDMQMDHDVIVVGGGGSGLAAAVSAAESGGSVLVLEKQPQLGGTTGIAVGSYTAAATCLQRDAGISDSPASHAEDVKQFAPPRIESRNSNPEREWFLEHAAETLEWLRSMGISFVGPSPEPPNSKPRMHNVVPGARAYIRNLQVRFLALGGQLKCRTHVLRLLEESGRIVGVQYKQSGRIHEARATRGVILAAGDYAANQKLIARFKGRRFEQIEGINPSASGDGQLMAEEIGADLINMDVTYGPELRFVASRRRPFQQVLPASGWTARIIGMAAAKLPDSLMRRVVRRLLVTWQHPEDSLFEDGALLLNRRGSRFTDERVSPEREIAVADQPGKQAWILMDQWLIERYSRWPHFISTAPDIAYAYVKDYLRLRSDVAQQFKNLDHLARSTGMERNCLLRSAQQQAAVRGNQRQDSAGSEARDSSTAGGPWVLLGPVKSWFTTTEGGARVDRRLRVLHVLGHPIPGLYAVGQNGLSGMILWSHGLHIAWAMTSGRLAGTAIMSDPPGSC